MERLQYWAPEGNKGKEDTQKAGGTFQGQTGPQTPLRAFQPTVKAGGLELCQTISQIGGDHYLSFNFMK